MNLVYACVFFQDGYCQLAELLLKSFAFTNPISNDIHFLVLCNEKFQRRIESLMKSLHIRGSTWVMEFDTIPTAAMARLQIFDYPSIGQYSKILYVDCDVLITGELQDLFALELDEKLYGLMEGNTKDDMWGARLFRQGNPKIPAMCSGVLLFQPNSKIKTLFRNVKDHMNHYRNKDKLPCYDQPFLIYHAIELGVLENTALDGLVQNNPKSLGTQVVSHFPLWPGHYECKIHDILAFLKLMVTETPKVHDGMQSIWRRVYLKKRKFVCSDKTELCFDNGTINGSPFSFCEKNMITFQDEKGKKCFIRFDSSFEQCIFFETNESTAEFFEPKTAHRIPFHSPIYYICSLGGAASKWLEEQLHDNGPVYHVHSRVLPEELEYVVNGQFTGKKIPMEERERYHLLVLEQDPVMAILDVFDDPTHLLTLGCHTCPDIFDVVRAQTDLYNIEEFYQKYRESSLPFTWTSVDKVINNVDNIWKYLNINSVSSSPKFHCPYEIGEVIDLNRIQAYQSKPSPVKKENLACRRHYFQSCNVVLRTIEDVDQLVFLKPGQWVGMERIILQYDFKKLEHWFSFIKYPFSVQIIDSDEDSCCFSVRSENIKWLQKHPWVQHIVAENWIGGCQEKVVPMPIGLCSRTFDCLEEFLASEQARPSFGGKKCRVSVTFAHMLHQRSNGETTNSGFLPEREDALSILRQNPLVDVLEPMTFPAYLAHYNEYQFTASPLGNGADCHRTWEALLRGTIPIVKKGPLDYLYACHDFPIVIVDEWSDISEENLKEWATMLAPKLAKLGPFTRTHLLQKALPSSEEFFFAENRITT